MHFSCMLDYFYYKSAFVQMNNDTHPEYDLIYRVDFKMNLSTQSFKM